MKRLALALVLMCAVCGIALAQQPVAILPSGITYSGGSYVGTVIDTTYSLPTGGTTWAVHSSSQFTTAIANSVPGDVIVLDAGVTYSGNWQLPQKSNPSNKWIYITTSAYGSLPPPGTRVGISDGANMPTILSPGNTAAIILQGGANHYRFVGIQMSANSNYPPGCPGTRNCTTGNFIGVVFPPNPMPDHIFVDRCYFHGTATQDIQGGFLMNGSNMAVVDSYIDDVHYLATDSWGLGANVAPGPIKIVNNFIAASSENIIFGGGGGGYGGYLPSDIEVRHNHLFKPLAWIPLSVTQHKMVIKNLFECKACARVLVTDNVMENSWADGQLWAVALTVRTGQDGNFAVVNDITFTNNLLLNVTRFFTSLPVDDTCGPGGAYPACTNGGSQDRWNISNNLVTYFDPTALGGTTNAAFSFGPSIDRNHGNAPGQMRNVLFQHNTLVQNGNNPCWAGAYWNTGTLTSEPPAGLTLNVWIIDNVLCRQPYGAWGSDLTALYKYMRQPTTTAYDLPARFTGNVMQKQGDPTYTWPPNNVVTPSLSLDPTTYVLISPTVTTTDGLLPGYHPNGIILPLTYNSPVTLAAGSQGVAYGPVSVVATGGTQPYTYSLQSGSWPTGITLNSVTGVISGTPSVNGTFPGIVIKVVDSEGSPVTVLSPTLSLTIGNTLTYTAPTSFTNATQNAPYGPVAVTAAGGTPPYTCSLHAGTLPTGITLSACAISGTPTGTGTSSGIVLRVTDFNLTTADSGSLSLTVSEIRTRWALGSRRKGPVPEPSLTRAGNDEPSLPCH